MKTRFILSMVTILVLAMFIVNACSGSGSSDGGGSPPTVPDITLEKSSATAASIMKVSGLDIEACPLSTSEIRVGGQTAPALLNGKGEVVMILPLFYDEATKWSAPPSGPQDVEIYCNGTLLTTLPDAVTVTELQPAPGTTEVIIADYTQIIDDFEEIMAVLAPEPGIQQMLFTSYITAIKELLNGTSENSLPAVMSGLTQDNPEILALLDAAHAATGVNETMAAFKELMSELKIDVVTAPPLAPARSPAAPALSAKLSQPAQFTSALASGAAGAPVYIVDILTDDRLAQQIRIYDALSGFQEQVLSNKGENPFTALSLIGGILEVFGKKIPHVAAASVILGIINLAVKTLVVSSLPAKLKPIKLIVPKTTLENFEFTDSTITVIAENIPRPFTLTDLFSVALNALGIASGAKEGTKWVNALRKELLAKVSYLTNVIGVAFEQFSAAHPEIVAYDIDVSAAIPPMRFTTLGSTRELYTLYPDASKIIHPLSDHLEWQADDTHWGSTTIHLATVPGKFGDEMATSNKVLVRVGTIQLVLTQHQVSIPEGESVKVGVKLSAPPSEDQSVLVSVQRTSGDTDISVTSDPTMIFDNSNWDSYRDIDLAAAEDEDALDGVASISVRADVIVDDQTKTIEDTITATEIDNDKFYFVTNTNTVFIPEGGTGTFDIRLNQEPLSTVTAIIAHSGGDPDISIQSNNILVFDKTNWHIYRTVTLYASVDEDTVNGSAQIQISGNLAEIGNAFITAIEQEEGSLTNTLYIEGSIDHIYPSYHEEWSGVVSVTMRPHPLSDCTLVGRGIGAMKYVGRDYWQDGCHIYTLGSVDANVSVTQNNCSGAPSYLINPRYIANITEFNICPTRSWSRPLSNYIFPLGAQLNSENGYIETRDWGVGSNHVTSSRVELLSKPELP